MLDILSSLGRVRGPICPCSGVRRQAPRGAERPARHGRRRPAAQPKPGVGLEVERVAVAEIGQRHLVRLRLRHLGHARECAPPSTGAQAFRRASVAVREPACRLLGHAASEEARHQGGQPRAARRRARRVRDHAPRSCCPTASSSTAARAQAPYDVVLAFRTDARTPASSICSSATSPAPRHRRPTASGSRGRRRRRSQQRHFTPSPPCRPRASPPGSSTECAIDDDLERSRRSSAALADR